ncbi:MAG: hypothetical protein EA353_10110 [Puniceicoccaceae bacterium]|nr:MAG: hypothetical protein EA353_10110 [Puniceicoccaceae bacterium]
MLNPGLATKIYLATGVTDMRKSFNGLYALVSGTLETDPLSGHLFVFCNRRHDRIKILCIADPDLKELICPVTGLPMKPVFFEFAEGKHGTTPEKTLKNYAGILQTDGASNFGDVPSRTDIIHMNCWAHVRRYFVKAEEAGEKQAADYLVVIDRLFRRERIARRFRLNPADLLELRRRFSLPAVDALFAKALAYAQSERMLKTPLPKAINYTLARTGELRECFLHAPSRIDNNLAENALSPRLNRSIANPRLDGYMREKNAYVWCGSPLLSFQEGDQAPGVKEERTLKSWEMSSDYFGR